MNLNKLMKLKKISSILIIFSIVCITILATLYVKAIHKRDHLEQFKNSNMNEIRNEGTRVTESGSRESGMTENRNKETRIDPQQMEQRMRMDQRMDPQQREQRINQQKQQEKMSEIIGVNTTKNVETTNMDMNINNDVVSFTNNKQTQDENLNNKNKPKRKKNSEVFNNYYKFKIDIDANENKLLDKRDNKGFKDYLITDDTESKLIDFKSDNTQASDIDKKQSVNFNINNTCDNSLLNRYDYTMVDKNKWMIPKQYKSQNPSCLTKKQPNFKPSASLTSGVNTNLFEYQKLGKKLPNYTFKSTYLNDNYP